MDDMYCDSDDNNVILFTVINMFYTCQADVKTKITVGMFMCGDAEWRNVRSRNFYMFLLCRSATLYEFDLVPLQHVEVW